MGNTELIQTRIPHEDLLRIQEIVDKENFTTAAWLRMLVTKELDRQGAIEQRLEYTSLVLYLAKDGFGEGAHTKDINKLYQDGWEPYGDTVTQNFVILIFCRPKRKE